MRKLLLLSVLPLLMLACVRDEELPGPDTKGTENEQTEPARIVNKSTGARAGEILVKFRENVSDSLRKAGTTTAAGQLTSGLQAVDRVLHSIKAAQIKRVFPPCGRFEKRTRQAGLDRWYKITFDDKESLDRVAARLAELAEIKVVQFNVPVKRIGDFKAAHRVAALGPVNAAGPETDATEYPFNDPMLPDQWHYNNDGTLPSSKAGADINVFRVWEEFTTGSPDVIVTVVDEGSQSDHPDLKSNIWVNEAELNGQPGVDDDNNGYKDDIYGFDFYTMTGTIDHGEHGSHTSGTIAAMNNNGIGVCGIAGGDQTHGGVKIQSCGIFPSWSDRLAAGLDETMQAIKYGADNGAVISQNSWGWTAGAYSSDSDWENSTLEKEGIDYFLENAGWDADAQGNPVYVGPLDGGLVVFAAGNDGDWAGTAKSYPAAYDKVLSVASMGIDYTAAYYTCYGDWVDVTAPGGDYYTLYDDKGTVLSTVSGSSYGYMQGTSMACPHVSGIAALAVSYAHENGVRLKAEDLKRIIEENTNDIDQYQTNTYKGRMGSGYVDAYKVLSVISGMTGNQPPQIALADGYSADVRLPYWDSVEIRFDVTDPEGDQWTPVVDDPDEMLEVRQQDGQIILTVTGADSKAGTHTATVAAKDSEGRISKKITVTYTVLANAAPHATGTIDDILLTAIGQSRQMDVEGYFIDPDDVLTYSAEAVVPGTHSPSEAVAVSTNGSVLTYTSKRYGQAQINVSATDRGGLSATTTFLIMTRNGSVAVELYPNPVRDWLNIRMGVEGTIRVTVTSLSGQTVWSGQAPVTPQSPARINLSGLARGQYVVAVTFQNETYKNGITKA